MKPLFSKSEKELFHPRDPRRKALEDKLRSMGQNLKEFEGKIIEVDYDSDGKVSFFLFKNPTSKMNVAPWFYEWFGLKGSLSGVKK